MFQILGRPSHLCFALVSCCFFLNVPTVMSQNASETERVIFLGDSITQAGAGPNGYVTSIRKYFESKGAGVEVIGAGISGNRVPDLEKRLQKDVLDKKPTTVVIYIGINDVWHSQNGRGTSKKDYREGLERIIGKIKDGGAKVWLCTPSVIGEKADGSNPLDKMLDEYCAISRDVAQANHCGVIDLRKAFLNYLKETNAENKGKGILTNDGVHLNKQGNEFVARVMLGSLAASGDSKKLKHIVLFKFKKDADPKKVEGVVKEFAALKDKIDTIVDFEMGTNVSKENLSKGFTHAFVVTFADQAGIDAYLPHPAHQEFVKLLKPVIDDVLVIDYWIK